MQCSRSKEGLTSNYLSFLRFRRQEGTLRHVRIVHRGGGKSGGIISPSKVITPPEIPALKKGMASTLFIAITFASATDRDNISVAKFDIKSDHGTTSVEVRPTLGELLIDEGTKNMSQAEFDTAISILHGIQRISSTFNCPPKDSNSLPRTILQHLNLVSARCVYTCCLPWANC